MPMLQRRPPKLTARAVRLITVAGCAAFWVVLCIAAAMADDGEMPFRPGERLRFALRWTMVPAGEAVMEVLPMETLDGRRVYHFRLTAESNAFVDLFYKVRDRIDAYVDGDMTHTLRYLHKQREGGNRKDVRVRFDWRTATAQYTDGQKTRRPIALEAGTFDPLSAFYYTRMLGFESGVVQCPVTDGKKCVQGQARIVRRETIKIGKKTYDTILIEPDLKHVGGVFEKSKDAKIQVWVTADARRIPVKLASKVAVGHFVGELVAIEQRVYFPAQYSPPVDAKLQVSRNRY